MILIGLLISDKSETELGLTIILTLKDRVRTLDQSDRVRI